MKTILSFILIISLFPTLAFAQKKTLITIANSNNEEYVFTVEMAKSTVQKARGLMFREILCDTCGMIFDFRDRKNPVSMWMKDTKISLDMIGTDINGKIKIIKRNCTPFDETSINLGEVDFVIEINGGAAQKYKINVGDEIFGLQNI